MRCTVGRLVDSNENVYRGTGSDVLDAWAVVSDESSSGCVHQSRSVRGRSFDGERHELAECGGWTKYVRLFDEQARDVRA